jgi:hypothetical protein
MKGRAQAFDAATQQSARPVDHAAESFQVRSPYLTTVETCDYLRYQGKHRLRSLYRFLAQRGIRTARRGRRVLVLKADVDRAIGASRETR